MKAQRSLLLICIMMVFTFKESSAERLITVAFGDALPPYVIPQTDEGILLDLLKDTLEPEGFTLKPVYYPYARRLLMYNGGRADAVCDVSLKMVDNLEGYLSTIAYAYENIGVSLQKKGFQFTEIADLTNYSLLSWQGAREALGGEYAEMANRNTQYTEVADQKLQVKMLYAGRVEVIQLDRLIFLYYRNVLRHTDDNIDVTQPIDIFPLFGKNENGFLFHDQAVRDLFNKNFATLKVSGRYDEIIKKYTESLVPSTP